MMKPQWAYCLMLSVLTSTQLKYRLMEVAYQDMPVSLPMVTRKYVLTWRSDLLLKPFEIKTITSLLIVNMQHIPNALRGKSEADLDRIFEDEM